MGIPKDEEYNSPFILNAKAMAKAAGISYPTFKQNVEEIAKALGFKPGDIEALKQFTKDAILDERGTRQQARKWPCQGCDKYTGIKDRICKACKEQIDNQVH